MNRLKEYLDQMAPNPSREKDMIQNFDDIELTEEEKAEALRVARELKYTEIKKAEYWQKITSEQNRRKYTYSTLFNRLETSKIYNGQRFQIDQDNIEHLQILCMYFSGDQRLLEAGFSFEKGILLMGGLGVGKTHLMSFFCRNQISSYKVVSCRAIENKWLEAGKARDENVDVIRQHCDPIALAINSDPFGHKEMGICFDDLGAETIPSKRFGEEKNIMSEIIMGRYENVVMPRYMTHFTTNLTADDIGMKYGDRVRDRLREMCNVITFPDNAQSRRK